LISEEFMDLMTEHLARQRYETLTDLLNVLRVVFLVVNGDANEEVGGWIEAEPPSRSRRDSVNGDMGRE
jgi:hypothetical protein